jgi:beta-aspartyl-dipeptidase (metallo-type)
MDVPCHAFSLASERRSPETGGARSAAVPAALARDVIPPASLTLLRHAQLFDPEPRGLCDLLIGGERILAVAPAGGGELAPMQGLPGELCQTVDLQGARVIPGLIDAHVHVTGGGGESGMASRVPRVPFSGLTRGGVTTCVGVLGTDGTTRNVAQLVAATLALREQGLSAWCWTGSYQIPPITLMGSVRQDIVFCDPIIGAGEIAISDHRSSQPTQDELARVAADCHVAGLMSGKAGVLHLHLGDGARGLDPVRRLLDGTELPPRVFHPTHVNRKTRLFEEALELARRGCTVDVTAFPVEEGEDAHDAPTAIERYLASGAPPERLTCSSDGGGCLPTYDAQGQLVALDTGQPDALAGALTELIRRGQPLERVLPIFTRNVAALLRLTRKGRLAAGSDADLVVLDEKHAIRDVMARGRFVIRMGAATVRGAFEEAR